MSSALENKTMKWYRNGVEQTSGIWMALFSGDGIERLNVMMARVNSEG